MTTDALVSDAAVQLPSLPIVLGARDELQMLEIDARGVPAQVVDDVAGRNRPVRLDPCDTMRIAGLRQPVAMSQLGWHRLGYVAFRQAVSRRLDAIREHVSTLYDREGVMPSGQADSETA